MKIINTKFCQPYQLSPDTQLDVERPNLFFNDWGEQTFPVELPDTPLNRQMTGYADMLGNVAKRLSNINCTIQDGSFFTSCRQAILSAQRNKGISTSYYINEGSFLSRLSDTRLSDVFGEEVIPEIATVEQGLDFCRSLLGNTNPDYAIFPFIVDLDGERRVVNRIDTYDSEGNFSIYGQVNFHNSFSRTETVNGSNISLAPGYYITPLIRASYLLRRMFGYFGYILKSNFFDSTLPFKDMVFINNTIDSLVNGDIRVAHLIPDCMCSTLLNVYRKKFCCEFIPDEAARTVTIEFFKDIVTGKPSIDLSGSITSEPLIEFPEYKQLKIMSSKVVASGDTFDSTAEISSKYPDAYLDPDTGRYLRIGYSEVSEVIQVVADAVQPYYIGGNIPVYTVEVPDGAFSMIPPEDLVHVGSGTPRDPNSIILPHSFPIPYIGEGRTLNSTLFLSTSSEEDTEDESEMETKNEDQPPVLAFTYASDSVTYGTNHTGQGRWEYSLLYNGEFGIFERFYRDFDNLQRNSLHPIRAELLLSSEQKMNIKSHRKVLVKGQELLINKLAYKIGGKDEPTESEFFTTILHTPIIVAPPESERFLKVRKYFWKINSSNKMVTQADFDASPLKKEGSSSRAPLVLGPIYPLPPTKAIYDNGGRYYERYYVCHYKDRNNNDVYERIDWWLSPEMKNSGRP